MLKVAFFTLGVVAGTSVQTHAQDSQREFHIPSMPVGGVTIPDAAPDVAVLRFGISVERPNTSAATEETARSSSMLAASTWPVSTNEGSMTPLPVALSRWLREGKTLDSFLGDVMMPFRAVTQQSGAFTAAAVEAQRRTAMDHHRKMLLGSYLPFDANKDGLVSRDEIRSQLLPNYAKLRKDVTDLAPMDRVLDAEVARMMRLDTNEDGYVSQDEISDHVEPRDPGLGREDAYEYLELIPPAGVLTRRDLLAIALQTYAKIDEDGDGILSEEEASKVVRGGKGMAARLLPIPQFDLKPYSLGSLLLAGPDGVSSYAGFEASISGDRAASDTQPFTARWTGDTTDRKPSITLRKGGGFEIASDDCAKLGTSGSCIMHVRLSAQANGIYTDKLTVAMGGSSASIHVAGKASGWPDANLVWDPSSVDLAKEEPVLLTTKEDSETQTYMVRNDGPGPAAPVDLPMSDRGGPRARVGWTILPESTCVSQTIQPNGRCSVLFRARALSDGMFPVSLDLPWGRTTGGTRQLGINVVARGVAGRLPQGVLALGDACPSIGSRAEVAVNSYDEGVHTGYFASDVISSGKIGFAVVTAECEAWKRLPNGELGCDNPGSGRYPSTMRRYKAQKIEGPWIPTDMKPRFISATLTCRDERLSRVMGMW